MAASASLRLDMSQMPEQTVGINSLLASDWDFVPGKWKKPRLNGRSTDRNEEGDRKRGEREGGRLGEGRKIPPPLPLPEQHRLTDCLLPGGEERWMGKYVN